MFILPMNKPVRLLNKNFVLLWQGQLVSQIGSQAYYVAMMFWLKHQTESASLIGLIMMFATIPAVVLSPIAGTVVDRHSRKWIIVICDLLSGLIILVQAMLLFFAADNTDLIVGSLFVVAVLMSIISAFFRPAISASIPDLVPREKLATANSMNSFSMQISTFLGQGSGGVLYRLLGAPVLFLVDAISYIFSAISEMFITIPQVIAQKSKSRRELFAAFYRDTVEGYHFIWKNKGMRYLFVAAATLNFFVTPILILLPFYVEDFLGAREDWFGYLIAGLGAGAMLGYLAASTLKTHGMRRTRLVSLSLIAMSCCFGALGLISHAPTALALFVVTGVLNGYLNINIATILQLTTPSEIRGRVFALLGTLSGGLAPIAMGLSGVVADLLDRNIPLIFGICGVVALILSIILASNKDFRLFLAYEPVREPADAS